MIVVAERDKTKWLEGAFGPAHGIEHFCHAADGTGIGLESYLYKVAFAQRSGETKQAACGGNGLQFAFGALPVFEHHYGSNGATHMKARRTFLRIGLGKMSHDDFNMP